MFQEIADDRTYRYVFADMRDADLQTADAADGSGGESVHPNPEFPDEESIRQAVLADEFAAEQAQNTARKKEKRDAGSLLKDLIFGKE